jgi:CubicO group peptidase (beta-lactamase class C family)
MRPLLATVLLLLSTAAAASGRDLHSRLDAYLTAADRAEPLSGVVLVAHEGRVVYTRTFGDADAEWPQPHVVDGRFRIASITKPFTAVLTLRLVQAGKLRLDAPLSEYLPEYRKDVGERVTVEQLLNHTSGIPDFANLPGFWKEELPRPHTREELLSKWLSRDLEFEPGTTAKYNSTGFYLLGLIAERVTGKPYGQALREWVLDPAGLKDTGYDAPGTLVRRRVRGYVRTLTGRLEPAPYMHMANVEASGGMYSTAMDLWRFDRALASETLLSKELKARMFKAYAPDTFGKELSFGLGWYVGERELAPGVRVSVNEHGGNAPGFRAYVSRSPSDGGFIAMLFNDGDGSYSERTRHLSRDLMRIVRGIPVEEPRPGFARVLTKVLLEKGVAAAQARLPELTRTHPLTSPRDLNNIGYGLLLEGRMPEALFLFRLNIERFPQDANAYDSLGEACLVVKDLACARENYARALEMDPKNGNARQVLERLKTQ